MGHREASPSRPSHLIMPRMDTHTRYTHIYIYIYYTYIVKGVACRMFRFTRLSGSSTAAISLSGGRAGWFLSHLSWVWITPSLQGDVEPVGRKELRIRLGTGCWCFDRIRDPGHCLLWNSYIGWLVPLGLIDRHRQSPTPVANPGGL